MLPPPPPPHLAHPTKSGRVEFLLPEASETGQADNDTLYTAEAPVTSTESALNQSIQYEVLSADGDSVEGRDEEVIQGQ